MLTFVAIVGVLILAYATWVLAECSVYLFKITRQLQELIEESQRPDK